MKIEETEELNVNYGPRQTQSANVRRLEKRGFKNEGSTSLGIVLMKIDSAGFVEKYVVSISGRVQRYRSYKPSADERMRLPRDKSKTAEQYITL